MNFDDYYTEIIRLLADKGLTGPYKMAWLEFYERNLTPEEAISDPFAPIV